MLPEKRNEEEKTKRKREKRKKGKSHHIFYSLLKSEYRELKNNPLKEAWQIGKIFTQDKMNHYDICLLAMFLGVKLDELVQRKLPKVRQSKVYDNRVRELHEQGLNFRQIADMMGTSYDMVKLVAYGKYSNDERGRSYA